MSDAPHDSDVTPNGASLLPRDLTEDQLKTAPVMATVDALVIEESACYVAFESHVGRLGHADNPVPFVVPVNVGGAVVGESCVPALAGVVAERRRL